MTWIDKMSMTDEMTFWVQTELCADLLKIPIWTIYTFEEIKDDLEASDPMYKLIAYLVSKQMCRKDNPYNADHKHSWKVSQYVPVIKVALRNCKKLIIPPEFLSPKN